MDLSTHSQHQFLACAGDTPHIVTEMQDLGTLLRVSEFRDSLSCKLHKSAVNEARIAAAMKDTQIASKARSALQQLPDLDAICSMSPGQCSHRLLHQHSPIWKAVSGAICSLLEVLAQPGMEDLSERLSARIDTASAGPDSQAVGKSDQVQDANARGIKEYIKQESKKNSSVSQELLYFLVLNLQDLLIALERMPSPEISGRKAESKHS